MGFPGLLPRPGRHQLTGGRIHAAGLPTAHENNRREQGCRQATLTKTGVTARFLNRSSDRVARTVGAGMHCDSGGLYLQ